MNRQSLAALRRRLDTLCLDHLRDHCAEQAQRIEELERELHATQICAEQWQMEAEALREDVGQRGGTVCLHADGAMSIVYGQQEVRA